MGGKLSESSAGNTQLQNEPSLPPANLTLITLSTIGARLSALSLTAFAIVLIRLILDYTQGIPESILSCYGV